MGCRFCSLVRGIPSRMHEGFEKIKLDLIQVSSDIEASPVPPSGVEGVILVREV